MPLYEYRCRTCGDFEQWRRIADLDYPVHCLDCNEVASKIISVPNISLNSGRLPLKQNESPQVVTRKDMEPTPSRVQQAKVGRPWMVSHAPARY